MTNPTFAEQVEERLKYFLPGEGYNLTAQAKIFRDRPDLYAGCEERLEWRAIAAKESIQRLQQEKAKLQRDIQAIDKRIAELSQIQKLGRRTYP